MTEIPADAPRSPDGHYWWDGDKWNLLDQTAGGAAAQAGAAGGAEGSAAASAQGGGAGEAAGGGQESEARQSALAADGSPGEEAIAPNVQVA